MQVYLLIREADDYHGGDSVQYVYASRELAVAAAQKLQADEPACSECGQKATYRVDACNFIR